MAASVLTKRFSRQAVTWFARSTRSFSLSSARASGGIAVAQRAMLQRLRSVPAVCPRQHEFSTKAESVLSEFLTNEISAEKQVAEEELHGQGVPQMEGFKVSTSEDQVTLTKQIGKETLTVKFNVSLCVDSDATSGSVSDPEKQHQETPPAIACRPPFTVFVEKEKQNLVFECEFVQAYEDEELRSGDEHVGDLFNIEEIYMFSDEVTDETYSVRGDIIDGELYDNLMEYLSERGINSEFAQNLVRFATHYEHAQYISLLQKMRAFVSL